MPQILHKDNRYEQTNRSKIPAAYSAFRFVQGQGRWCQWFVDLCQTSFLISLTTSENTCIERRFPLRRGIAYFEIARIRCCTDFDELTCVLDDLCGEADSLCRCYTIACTIHTTQRNHSKSLQITVACCWTIPKLVAEGKCIVFWLAELHAEYLTCWIQLR